MAFWLVTKAFLKWSGLLSSPTHLWGGSLTAVLTAFHLVNIVTFFSNRVYWVCNQCLTEVCFKRLFLRFLKDSWRWLKSHFRSSSVPSPSPKTPTLPGRKPSTRSSANWTVASPRTSNPPPTCEPRAPPTGRCIYHECQSHMFLFISESSSFIDKSKHIF